MANKYTIKTTLDMREAHQIQNYYLPTMHRLRNAKREAAGLMPVSRTHPGEVMRVALIYYLNALADAEDNGTEQEFFNRTFSSPRTTKG